MVIWFHALPVSRTFLVLAQASPLVASNPTLPSPSPTGYNLASSPKSHPSVAWSQFIVSGSATSVLPHTQVFSYEAELELEILEELEDSEDIELDTLEDDE